MLQNFMDMGVYFYTVTGTGVLAVLITYLMNTITKKTIRDKTTYTGATRRLRKVTIIASIICLAVTALALGVSVSMGQVRTEGIRYLLTGAGIVVFINCFRKYLLFADRQKVLSDYLFQLIDRQSGLSDVQAAERVSERATDRAAERVAEKEPVPLAKELLVERAFQGIRETAASGENRFSHILSDEEENIMREVIGEYITQG